MNASMAGPKPDGVSHRLSSRRWAISISIGWATLLLLGAWLLSTLLGIIHGFESGREFEAHNREHWFRPIAFFWFDRYSVLPSLLLAVLIGARHAVIRSRRSVTFVLFFLTVLLLAVGAYTVWEHLAVCHQFVFENEDA
jgi:hypothetical protein